MASSAEFRVKDFELRRSRRFALWALAPGHRDHHCGLRSFRVLGIIGFIRVLGF